MCAVTAALKAVVGTQVKASLIHFFLYQLIDARVLGPVRRTNPHVRNVADITEHLFHMMASSILDIRDKQLVCSQAHHDVIGVMLFDEIGKPGGKSFNGSVEVYTANNVFTKSVSLDQIENELDERIFYRIHRQYIVGFKNIKSVSKNIIELTNGEKLTISRRKLLSFEKAYIEYDLNFGG